QGRVAAAPHRGTALPEARRVLLSRGDRARAADPACAADAGGGARRARTRCAGAISAAAGRARADGDRLERTVRAVPTARRACAHARPPRSAVRPRRYRGQAMSARRIALALLTALLLVGCDNHTEPTFQG